MLIYYLLYCIVNSKMVVSFKFYSLKLQTKKHSTICLWKRARPFWPNNEHIWNGSRLICLDPPSINSFYWKRKKSGNEKVTTSCEQPLLKWGHLKSSDIQTEGQTYKRSLDSAVKIFYNKSSISKRKALGFWKNCIMVQIQCLKYGYIIFWLSFLNWIFVK